MYDPISDYDDVMTAVEDGYIQSEDVHCKHGTFVGTAGGPDYLCHWCEDPDGDHQYELAQRWARRVDVLGPQLDEALRNLYAYTHADVGEVDLDAPVFRRYLRLLRWGVRSHLFWHPEELEGAPCIHACDDCGQVDRHDLSVEH